MKNILSKIKPTQFILSILIGTMPFYKGCDSDYYNSSLLALGFPFNYSIVRVSNKIALQFKSIEAFKYPYIYIIINIIIVVGILLILSRYLENSKRFNEYYSGFRNILITNYLIFLGILFPLEPFRIINMYIIGPAFWMSCKIFDIRGEAYYEYISRLWFIISIVIWSTVYYIFKLITNRNGKKATWVRR